MNTTHTTATDTPALYYYVIDTRTGDLVAEFKTRKGARALADRMDSHYGAVRFTVRAIFEK